MLKNFFRPILMTLSVSFFANFALAAPVESVATVDFQKLFTEYHLTKTLREKMKKQQTVFANKNIEKQKAIQKILAKMEELKKLIEDGSIAPKLKKQHMQEFKRQQNRGKALEQSRREWLKRMTTGVRESMNDESAKIYAQVKGKIEAYASANNIDIVYDKSARSISRTLVIISSKDKFDITAPLMLALNKDANKAVKPSTPAKP